MMMIFLRAMISLNLVHFDISVRASDCLCHLSQWKGLCHELLHLLLPLTGNHFIQINSVHNICTTNESRHII